jgi:hypothetical protein
MGNQFLTLGLFIMLLSFFIVLNSMSSFEDEKAKSVVDSIKETFLEQKPMEEEMVAQQASAKGESFREGDALDNVKSLFQSTIPGIKATKNRFGNVMTVELPLDQFETALNAYKSKNAAAQNAGDTDLNARFTDILVALLDTKISMPYEMEILVSTPEGAQNMWSGNSSKALELIKRAGGFAETLESRGLDPKLVSPGVTQGPEGTVVLIFQHYEPLKLELKS